MLHMFGFIKPFFMNLNKSNDEKKWIKRNETELGTNLRFETQICLYYKPRVYIYIYIYTLTG